MVTSDKNTQTRGFEAIKKVDASVQTDAGPHFSMDMMVKYLMQQNDPLLFAK